MNDSDDLHFGQPQSDPVLQNQHQWQWQWTTVTFSLAPPSPSHSSHSDCTCSHPQHRDDQDGEDDQDEQLARILAAQWDAEDDHQPPLPPSRPPPPSSSSSTSPSPPQNTDDYAHLAHLPADQVFASEGPLFNLHARFQYYNARHFHSTLSACEARWSTRMTLCAGQCHYQPASGYCSIRLSHPLLQFRPKQDCINTLLHEMIHAYLFITDGNDDHDGHGPAFHEWMRKLNAAEHDTKITVFHTFKDEVNEHRKHVWQCNGPCKDVPPFFGIVRRAMNRPPQKADWWFEKHARECGGTYEKIAGPEPKAKPATKRRKGMVEDGQATAVKKRKVKEDETAVVPRSKGNGKGKIDGYLVKEGRPTAAAAQAPSLPAGGGGDVVDLTLDSDSDTDDDIILVRSSSPW